MNLNPKSQDKATHDKTRQDKASVKTQEDESRHNISPARLFPLHPISNVFLKVIQSFYLCVDLSLKINKRQLAESGSNDHLSAARFNRIYIFFFIRL